ncbi:MAG: hypothetical protein QM765_43520 [Myxococcales bacterium]
MSTSPSATLPPSFRQAERSRHAARVAGRQPLEVAALAATEDRNGQERVAAEVLQLAVREEFSLRRLGPGLEEKVERGEADVGRVPDAGLHRARAGARRDVRVRIGSAEDLPEEADDAPSSELGVHPADLCLQLGAQELPAEERLVALEPGLALADAHLDAVGGDLQLRPVDLLGGDPGPADRWRVGREARGDLRIGLVVEHVRARSKPARVAQAAPRSA